ncbi:uncharacterized protein LOC125498744 [Beta vulgaris subsp. vulgaris]|uniref:uncharacterized protein LOC125498744 n=1 Tax=Beta vulgaris subsp. vulgaris TaxID=3555 RepID=UPI00203691E3|nr:uncharacterized protein LOC125498744 [Beta vulgaris subsp. vulgaris]
MDEQIAVEELIQLEEYLSLYPEDDDIDSDMEVCFSSESESENEEDTSNSENRTNVINFHREGNKKNLTNDQRKFLVDRLLMMSTDGVLPKGAMKTMCEEYNVTRVTLWRLWSTVKSQLQQGLIVDVNNKKKGRAGRKPKEWDLEKIKAIPIEKRTTIRALANALEIGISVVYRLMKSGKLRAHTSSIKPSLSDKHKINRLRFILGQIIPRTVDSLPRFSCMYNVIHIDEKWFYMSKQTQRFYLFPWEEEPYRACQNKRFIPKVMFEGVVARPIIAENGVIIWDGKIGIFAFTQIQYAKRNSCNRDVGTAETKAIQSITKEVIRSKLINEVLPAIRAKWPAGSCKEIWIQQDNARPHINVNDADFNEAATKDGFQIRLTCQPAQSPDLNVLDLGFFAAIQSLQYKAFPSNVDELVKAVEDAFDAFEPKSLSYTWLHYKYIMLEVLNCDGGNKYKNPHKGKKKLDNLGLLPTEVEVPEDLIQKTMEHLQDAA